MEDTSGNSVEFFFDCGSPWTYLGFENILGLSKELRFEIVWRPILVGAVFKAVNASVYQSRTDPVPAKDAYIRKDIKDWSELAGLSILFPPSVFPVNSAQAMRGCIVAQRIGAGPAFARAVFEAYWRDDRDISDPQVIAAVCGRVGVDPETFLPAIDAHETKQELRDNTAELIRRGGFGSPTMFVNGHDMYFGNDHMVLVRRALEKSGVGSGQLEASRR